MSIFDQDRDFRRQMRTKRAKAYPNVWQGIHVITLYNTNIVNFDSTRITLDDGGWMTNTTKTRMNQVSSNYGLGFHVYQDKGNWFVQYKGRTIPYQSGMVLRR